MRAHYTIALDEDLAKYEGAHYQVAVTFEENDSDEAVLLKAAEALQNLRERLCLAKRG